jgi:hypothetical protein
MTTMTAPTGTTTKQKIGLVLCGLYSLANIASVFFPTPSGQTGPPFGILLVDTILGVIGVVATVLAWRGSELYNRIAAGVTILITLTSLPALFVDVPAAVKALVGVSIVLTVAIVALMFSGRRAEAGF